MNGFEQQAEAGDGAAQLSLARALNARGRREEAEAWLRRAVAADHVPAMAALGRHLLTRPPPAPPGLVEEARRFLAMAGERGDGDAAHLTALMLAIDPKVPRNWSRALDFLGHAAAGGHSAAQAQLAFLTGDDGASTDWSARRASLDLNALLAVPTLRTLSTAPYIAVAEGFLSPKFCDWVIARAAPKLAPAQVYDRKGGATSGLSRTNSVMHFPFPEMDLLLFLALQRAGSLMGVPIQGMEPTAVLHYRPGEAFQPHHDYLDPRRPGFAADIARAGQRIATFLIYLSDDFEGGETHFPELDIRFRGRKGDAILFHNVDRQGRPDPRTLHAGLPPGRGEKWLLSQWIRGARPPVPR
jgi:hypothetical protein